MKNSIFLSIPGSENGDGNGNPLQCSCLENPRDGGAWWAAVYGVTQSQTQLKRLSSSSSIAYSHYFTVETNTLRMRIYSSINLALIIKSRA